MNSVINKDFLQAQLWVQVHAQEAEIHHEGVKICRYLKIYLSKGQVLDNLGPN